jgi:60 kDa SS-A/Ro ribonucleoprotein
VVWKALARQMGPQALRMNLNTLQRHGVCEDPEMVQYVAGRLSDAAEIRRARQFPYQYLAAFLNAEDSVPFPVRAALEQAAEHACGNVPQLPGPVVVGLDVSGSMTWPITGSRGGRAAVRKMRCVDVAALFAAAVVRRNPGSVVIPFDTRAYSVEVSAGERILALAARLSRYGGGGTDSSAPLAEACRAHRERRFAGCVLVSDNESWVGTGRYGTTAVLTQWQRFVGNQVRPHEADFTGPKLVCIDLQANTTAQAPGRSDILNVGGFSDAVFEVVSAFLRDNGHTFVKEVEASEV